MKLANSLHERDWPPIHTKKGKNIHTAVSKLEKEKFGAKDFKKLYRLGQSLPPGEILGHISKSGKITLSKKVPKSLRKEVVFHEREEWKQYK